MNLRNDHRSVTFHVCSFHYRSSQNYYRLSCYSWEFISPKLPLPLPSWSSDDLIWLQLPSPSWRPQWPLHFQWFPITILKVIRINSPKCFRYCYCPEYFRIIRQEKRAQRLTFFGPETAGWGWGLPHEGVGVEKFVPSLESLSSLGFEERNPRCPGNFAGMSRTPGGLQKFVQKKTSCAFFRNESSAQRGSFWPDIPADIRPKTSVRRSKSWKKTSILERTSRADVHGKTSVRKTSGWFFVP